MSRTTTHDLLGNPITYSKIVNYAGGGSYTHNGDQLTYNAAGQLTLLTNALGQQESYTYDADGHLLGRTRFDGTTFTYHYDPAGKLLQLNWSGDSIVYTYLASGHVQSVTDASGTIEYAYNLDGGAKSITYPNGLAQTYTADKFSRVVSQQDCSGAITTMSFDSVGRMASRSAGGDTMTYTYGTVNHQFGILTGDSLSGQRTLLRTYAYDGFGQMQSSQARDGAGQLLLSNVYVRDAAGRMTTMTVSSSAYSDPAINLSKRMAYDGINQLIAATTSYANHAPGIATTFSYDGNSNVIARSDNGVARSFSYNAIDQLQAHGVVYDTNGRMLSDGNGQRSYVYNALDQLLTINTAPNNVLLSHAYHADASMATSVSTASTANFYYNGGSINAINASSGGAAATWTSFMYSGSNRTAAYPVGQSASYYLTSNTSTSALLSSGNQVIALDYDAFGASVGGASLPSNQSFTWNQEYNDNASGLVYLRARWYNPALMGFLTMDSVNKDNRYAYCSGDPFNLMDPTGHSETRMIVAMSVGLVVGIVATVVTGGVAGVAAAAIFGTESVAASIGAAALAGSAGVVAGDLTSAGINGEKITGQRVLVDVLSGAVGGAVGAGVGGIAGRTAMRAALSAEMSQRAITNIGLLCSGVAGGLAGSAAAAGVTSVAYGQPFFSANTALSMVIGAAAGVGGGFLTSGAYLGKVNAKLIPVPLTEAELGLITPAMDPGLLPNSDVQPANLQRRLLVMAPQPEANESAGVFRNMPGGNRSAQTLDYGAQSMAYDTIAAHGMGNTMFASVEYRPSEVLNGQPNYARPIEGRLFARYLQNNPNLIGGIDNSPIKLMVCFGAFSNAQTIASALGRDVFAGYPEINRFSFTNWSRFTP